MFGKTGRITIQMFGIIGEASSSIEISGFVFNDLNMDTTFNGQDTAIASIDVKLFHDVDSNGIYNSATDTFLETVTTNLNGYYSFRKSFTNGNDGYIVIADASTFPTNFVFTTDSTEMVTFISGNTVNPNNNFGIINASSLPVDMLSFDADAVEQTVELTWITANQINNQGFEIERSTDGIHFETLDFVVGAGTVQQKQFYQFTDYTPNLNGNFYRLKQVDFDGKFEYSVVKYAEFKNDLEQVTIYPNPSKNVINVEMNDGRRRVKAVQIVSMTGAVVVEVNNVRTL